MNLCLATDQNKPVDELILYPAKRMDNEQCKLIRRIVVGILQSLAKQKILNQALNVDITFSATSDETSESNEKYSIPLSV